jgi:hypothetical protein
MPSARKSEASRINGAKSRGPKTAEGRAISSRNATTHGLTAKTLILRHENPADFLEMYNGYFDHFHPTNQTEICVVCKIVVARWRLSRSWRYQTASLDMEMNAQAAELQTRNRQVDEDRLATLAFSAIADAGGHVRALRTEGSMTRAYHKAVEEFRRLRAGILPKKNQILQVEPEILSVNPLNTIKNAAKISTDPKETQA